MICTFFGHRDVPPETVDSLRAAVVDLIEQQGVTDFYAGDSGAFDAVVHRVLSELAKIYPIRYGVVLSRLPRQNRWEDGFLPDGIETVPPRFAIAFRNDYMLRRADYVVAYVAYSVSSCAARWKEKALRAGKTVVELAGI